jgi:hypothetical protein
MPNPSDIALYLKAEVLGINKVQDKLISAPELAKLTGFCKTTILSKCKHLNVGTVGKAMYNKDAAIAALSANNKVGRKRKN